MHVLSARITALATAAFLLAVLAFAYAGLFSRYVADDFCTARTLVERGFVGAQQYWYLNWSGRFAFILLIDGLNWLGAWTVPLTPMLLLVAWVAATAAAIGPLLAHISRGLVRGPALLLSLVLVTSTLATAPSLWEVMYWQTGSITYLLPIILTTAFVAMVWRVQHASVHNRPTLPWIVAGSVLVVVGVGSSETSMALLVASLALAILGIVAPYRRPHRQILLATLGISLAAGLLASAAVVAAPGNAVRSTFFDRPPLALAVVETLWFPFYLVFEFLLHAPVYVVLSYAAPFLLVRRISNSEEFSATASLGKTRRLVMAGGLLAIAAAGAPSFFVGGGAPSAGAKIIPQFVFIALLMCCGALDGLARRSSATARRQAWRTSIAAIGGGLLIVVGPLLTTYSTLAQADEFKAHAATLDNVEQQARQARANGDLSLILVRDVTLRTDELSADSSTPPNTCIAAYYGLESIQAVDPKSN